MTISWQAIIIWNQYHCLLIPCHLMQTLTMPTWDAGPARLVTLSPPVVLTALPITTIRSTTTTNRTRAVMVQSQERTVDDLTVSKWRCCLYESVLAVLLFSCAQPLFTLLESPVQFSWCGQWWSGAASASCCGVFFLNSLFGGCILFLLTMRSLVWNTHTDTHTHACMHTE